MVGGKNLTMFQSVGLLFMGMLAAGGIGAPVFLTEFLSASRYDTHIDAIYLLLGAGAMFIWGLVMIINGLGGIVRNIRRRKINK